MNCYISEYKSAKASNLYCRCRLVAQMPVEPMPIEQQLACWHNRVINCRLIGESRGRFTTSLKQNGRHEFLVAGWYEKPAGETYVAAIRGENGMKVNIPFLDIADVRIVPEEDPDKEPEFLDCTRPRVATTIGKQLVGISNISTLSMDYNVVRPRQATPPPLDNSPQPQPQPSPSTAASLTSTATTTPPFTTPAEVPCAAQSPAAGL